MNKVHIVLLEIENAEKKSIISLIQIKVVKEDLKTLNPFIALIAKTVDKLFY